ncbi:MAG: YraN family protein [Candidatus Poribacteria bacterium]
MSESKASYQQKGHFDLEYGVTRLLNFKKLVGNKGESIAEDYLKQKGYKIIQKNYRCRFGEIDIIAKDQDTIVFVEVRTKQNDNFGSPQDSITPAKIEKISKTSLSFIQEKKFAGFSYRFDFIAITFSQGKPNIEHIENAFIPIDRYMF